MAKTAPKPDEIPRQQYVKLIEELAARTGGKTRGWQRRVAAALGVSAGFLSKVLRHDQPIGDESIRRAQEVGVPASYFADPAKAPGEYVTVQSIYYPSPPRLPKSRRAEEPPSPSLIRVHRMAVARARARMSGGDDAPSAAEIVDALRGLAFAREIDKPRTADRDDTIVWSLLHEVGQLYAWAGRHPEEATLQSVASGPHEITMPSAKVAIPTVYMHVDKMGRESKSRLTKR